MKRFFCPFILESSARKMKGSILISVLWIIAMLAVFSVAVNRQASAQLVFGRWMMDRTQAQALAKAGFERALFEIQRDKFVAFDALNESWASSPNIFKDKSLGEGVFLVVCESGSVSGETALRSGACDESARININTAPEETLKNLFKAVLERISDDEAVQFAEAIIDWRDSDDQNLAHGAESGFYKSQREPYEAGNRKFESAEELLLVRGITSEIWEKIAPYVTVYTGGKVNFNTASVTVLRALGLNEDLANRIREFRMGADLKGATADDEVFQYVDGIAAALSSGTSFTPEDFVQVSNAISSEQVGVASEAFRIQAIGRLIRGSKKIEEGLSAVVKRDGTVLYWKEGISGSVRKGLDSGLNTQ